MQNTFKTNVAPIISSLLALAILALPAFAATGPGATPPSGNVGANFNSIYAENSDGKTGVTGVSTGGVSDGDGVRGIGGGDGIVDGAGGIGGNFTGKRFGVRSRVNSSTVGVAAGHFENVASGYIVDVGLADLALQSQGPVTVKGKLTTEGDSSFLGYLSAQSKSGTLPAGYFKSNTGLVENEVNLAGSSNAILTKGDITVSSGDINVSSGKITVGSVASISSTGHIKAAGGVGRFYTAVGSSILVSAGQYVFITSKCDDLTKHRRISCGFTTSASNVVQADMSDSSYANQCDFYVKNLNTGISDASVTGVATCFDPNG